MEPTTKLPIMSKGKCMPEYTRPQAVNMAMPLTKLKKPKTVPTSTHPSGA